MRTELNLTQLSSDNNRILLADTSVYNPDLQIENSYLEVTPPGFSGFIQVLYIPESIIVLTAQNLKLASGLEALPSGIYHVLQTIKPNDRLKKEFLFLHASQERYCLAERLYYAKENGYPVTELTKLFVELEALILLVQQADPEDLAKYSKVFSLLSKTINNL